MTLQTWPCSHCGKKRNAPCGSPCLGNDRLHRGEMRQRETDPNFIPEDEVTW